jgi:hypothetical protein
MTARNIQTHASSAGPPSPDDSRSVTGRFQRSVIALVLVVWGVPGSAAAYAQPHFYQVTLDGSDELTLRSYDPNQPLSKSNETVSGDPDQGADYIITRSRAAAGWGSLAVSAHAYLDFPIAGGGVGTSEYTSAESYFLVRDLMITGPDAGLLMASASRFPPPKTDSLTLAAREIRFPLGGHRRECTANPR